MAMARRITWATAVGQAIRHSPIYPHSSRVFHLFLPPSPHHSGRKSTTRISRLSLNPLRSLPGPCQSFVRQFSSLYTLFVTRSTKFPAIPIRHPLHVKTNPRNHVQAFVQIDRSRGQGCQVEEVVPGSREVVEIAEVVRSEPASREVCCLFVANAIE